MDLPKRLSGLHLPRFEIRVFLLLAVIYSTIVVLFMYLFIDRDADSVTCVELLLAAVSSPVECVFISPAASPTASLHSISAPSGI